MIGSKHFVIGNDNVFTSKCFNIGDFGFVEGEASEAYNAKSFQCNLNRTTSITLRFDYWDDPDNEEYGYIRLIASIFCKPLVKFTEAIIVEQWDYTHCFEKDAEHIETLQDILKRLFTRQNEICDSILLDTTIDSCVLREVRNVKEIVTKLLGIIYVSQMTDHEKIDHLSKQLETLRNDHEELKEKLDRIQRTLQKESQLEQYYKF